MERLKIKIGAMDAVFVAVSLAFLLGLLFLFGPCGPKEDGDWMTCHWAGNAVTGLAGVLFVVSLLRLLAPKKEIKTGLSLAVIPVSLLACLLPGRMIQLCMMKMMRCHAVMAPAVTIFGILMIVISVIDIAAAYRRGKQ